MGSQQHPWERMPEESLLWYHRFEAFRLMEPVRSIAAVFREEEAEKNRGKPRTDPPGQWYEAAKQWRWEERAAAFDLHQDAEIEKRIVAERKKVLRSRFALQHKRIETLDRVAQQLLDYLEDEANVWLPDVKAVAGERVDILRFNAPLLDSLRGYLGDIAAEKGERRAKNDVYIKELPKEYNFDPDQDGVEE
jgi:hypothetical protein